MKVYLCQMIGFDKTDAWTEVEEYDARTAARVYAQLCDERSGGRLFENARDEDVAGDERIIAIQGNGSFVVAFEYSRAKTFYTKDG